MNITNWQLWLVVFCIGLFTFASRLSFILFADRLGLSPALRRALRFVPIAALSAIIAPELLIHQGQLVIGPNNLRLIAGVIAAAVAWRTRNVLWTIVIGMGTLWLLQLYVAH